MIGGQREGGDTEVAEVSLAEAAEMLGISRTPLVAFLKRGELPYRMDASRRRIPVSAIHEYRARLGASGLLVRAPSREERQRGLCEMADLTAGLGLGY